MCKFYKAEHTIQDERGLHTWYSNHFDLYPHLFEKIY